MNATPFSMSWSPRHGKATVSAGLFDTLKSRYREAHGGAEPGIASVLSFGVASAFCGQVTGGGCG